MGLEKLDVRLTDHAHEQYCMRVHVINKEDLRARIMSEMQVEYYRKEDFIRIEGIWWIFAIKDDVIVMVTCYGRSDFDLPAAKKWARLHNDRIDLTGGEVLCDGEADGKAEEVRRLFCRDR